MGVTSFISNVTVGNIVGATLDGAGLIVDVAATAIPVIPGGAATAIKAVRGAKIAEKIVKNAAVKSAVRKGVKKKLLLILSHMLIIVLNMQKGRSKKFGEELWIRMELLKTHIPMKF